LLATARSPPALLLVLVLLVLLLLTVAVDDPVDRLFVFLELDSRGFFRLDVMVEVLFSKGTLQAIPLLADRTVG